MSRPLWKKEAKNEMAELFPQWCAWIHLHVFPPFSQRVTTSVISDCPRRSPPKMGSTVKGKNFFLWKQILSFMSRPLWKNVAKNEMAELFSLKIYPFA